MTVAFSPLHLIIYFKPPTVTDRRYNQNKAADGISSDRRYLDNASCLVAERIPAIPAGIPLEVGRLFDDHVRRPAMRADHIFPVATTADFAFFAWLGEFNERCIRRWLAFLTHSDFDFLFI